MKSARLLKTDASSCIPMSIITILCISTLASCIGSHPYETSRFGRVQGPFTPAISGPFTSPSPPGNGQNSSEGNTSRPVEINDDSGAFSYLPDEVVIDIMSYGDSRDWRVCRRLDSISRDPRLAQSAAWVRINSQEGLQRYIDEQECQAAQVKINYGRFNNEDLRRLVRANPHITTLNLSGCRNISDVGLGYLSTLRNLTALYLSGCCDYLTAIGLSLTYNNPITTYGLSHLPNSLKTLDLSRCHNVGSARSQSLGLVLYRRNVDLRYLPRGLTTLDLSQTNVGDTDLYTLGVRCPSLTKLNLFGCLDVTDVGLRHLPRSLRELNLWMTGVTDAAITQLRSRYSNLVVRN